MEELVYVKLFFVGKVLVIIISCLILLYEEPLACKNHPATKSTRGRPQGNKYFQDWSFVRCSYSLILIRGSESLTEFRSTIVSFPNAFRCFMDWKAVVCLVDQSTPLAFDAQVR